MFNRMLRAMRLDSSLYDEVEVGDQYDRESWLVVVVVALLSAVLGGFAAIFSDNGGLGAAVGTFFGFIVSALITFILSVLVIWLVGQVLGGRGTFGELRRALAYAYSPLILAGIPCVNILVLFWYLAATFVATRQAHDISNGRTAVIIILAGIVQLVASMLLLLVGIGTGLGLGAL